MFGNYTFSRLKNEKNKHLQVTIESVILVEMVWEYHQSIANFTLISKMYSDITIAFGKAEIL